MSLQTSDNPIVPVGIERTADGGLAITWSDRSKNTYTVVALRDGCPCATCREKLRAKEKDREEQAKGLKPFALPVLGAGELKPLAILSMMPIGNYAYTISFSDGHSSGIYTFDLLRSLGSAPSSAT